MSKLSRELDIPLVATNNVHHATPDGRRLADILCCIKNHTTLDMADSILYPNHERYLKTYEQIQSRFSDYPDAVSNTVAIADRCTFELNKLETSLPDFPVSPNETVHSYLRRLTYQGARDRYRSLQPHIVRQIEHELDLIERLNLSAYFLIVWDIARFARETGILCQGRGSAANSAVCYCLKVTAVDPIGLELLFERFISESRAEPPDIDIDLANNRREEVIQYVYEKYGREHAAMVCEVISYRGRSAVRDVGKALGFSLDEVGQLAKLINHYADPEELDNQLGEINLKRDNKRVALLIEMSRQIKNFPRHLGIHSGGMIITKRKLSQLVPIENATMPNRSVIAWDKDDAAEAGMVKIDLLGLGMLTLIDLALELIKKHHRVIIDPARLSYDDPKVYDLICKADTVGVFQIESRAQMNALPRHKPRCFYDLVIEVALIRPGPIQGDMVLPYLRRRNGEEKIEYFHPCLEPILKRTLGVPLFQEQGMKVAVAAAGFSHAEADELRRAMGHKRSREKMAAISERLIHGMMKNGISHEQAQRIFDQLAAFADFGFAESHAASFALLVYVSAWLKVYYPAEFYCSLLNAQPMGFYSSSTIIYEGKRRGMEFLPVDVTISAYDCTVENQKVRLGFRMIKSIGESSREIIETETAIKPFDSIRDLYRRTSLNRAAMEQLAISDAFASFGLTRRQAFWKVLAVLQEAEGELQIKNHEKGNWLLTDMTTTEKMATDFAGMGLSVGPHLMQLIRRQMKLDHVLAAVDLEKTPAGRVVDIAGVVVIRQHPVTSKGFIFITLEDETGFANIVIKPAFTERYRKQIMFSSLLLVRGVVEKSEGVINVIGHRFTPLELKNGRDIHYRSRDWQ